MEHPEQPVAPPAGAPSSPIAPTSPSERRWTPPLVVLGVILFVTFGGFFLAGEPGQALRTEPETVPTEAPPVSLGLGITIVPAEGWAEAARYDDPEGLRLSNGIGHLDAYALTFSGSAEQLMRDYVEAALRSQASQIDVTEPEPAMVGEDLDGVRVTYTGLFGSQPAAIEGEVTVATTEDGTGVVFDGWTQQGQLGFILPQIHAMVVSVGGG